MSVDLLFDGFDRVFVAAEGVLVVASAVEVAIALGILEVVPVLLRQVAAITAAGLTNNMFSVEI